MDFPSGGLVAIEVVGSVDGFVSGALAGLLAGMVIGAAQWMALRRRFAPGPRWIAATALGLSFGQALAAAATGAGTSIGALLTSGAIVGATVGVMQWTVLKDHVLTTHRQTVLVWPVIVAIAWPIGWIVTWSVGVDVERGYAVFGASGALVFATITGAAMVFVTRHQDPMREKLHMP